MILTAGPRVEPDLLSPDQDVVISLNRPLTDSVEVGQGAFLIVEGRLASRRAPLSRLALRVGDGKGVNANLTLLEPGQVAAGYASHFWARIPLSPVDSDSRIQVGIEAEAALVDGRKLTIPVKSTQLQPVELRSVRLADGGTGPLVAICMATFRPDRSTFERQIESIRNQTYENWICIISDDASGGAYPDTIREVCGDDRRFFVFENSSNQGFYKNFETVLRYVPREAQFTALSDQDDYWYPRKLEKLIGLFDKETVLVYSDMRIVNDDGSTIAQSYWENRRNNYTDLDIVLIANTVTGAASMFRSELITRLLPFPQQIGDAFHDHWISCVALSLGKMQYIDEPLYDYYQYGSSVIGHCDFTVPSVSERLTVLGRSAAGLLRSPRKFRVGLMKAWFGSLAVYRYECRRLELITRTLQQRCGPMRRDQEKALALFNGGWGSVARLLIAHLSILRRRQTTDDAELRLAMGYLIRQLQIARDKIRLLGFRLRPGNRATIARQR